MHFTLLRLRQSSTRSGAKWEYLNRVVDAQGVTLYSGLTPQHHFTTPVVFKDASNAAIRFGANRSVAPSAYVTHSSGGIELFRIDLPVAAKLRTRSSMFLTDAETGDRLEIVPSHVASSSEAARLIAVLQEEFVVRRDGRSVAHTGQFDPENVDDDFAKTMARQTAATVLSDLSKIPANIARMRREEGRELPAGRLTVREGALPPQLVLTLLLFRAYIYKEIQSPRTRWWQG